MAEKTPAICWKNGEIITTEAAGPDIASMSLHMGLAVIEGLLAYPRPDGRHYVHRAEAHFIRLRRGAEALGFPCPYDVQELLKATEDLLAGCAPGEAYYIRPIVMRGAAHLWLTGIEQVPVDTTLIAVPSAMAVEDSLRLCVVPVERLKSAAIPVSWKISGGYANSYLSRRAAASLGYDDGIMLDERGCLAEASAANVFVVSDGQLFTPALRGSVFPGITRMHVLEIASALGIEWQERDLELQDLEQAQAVFISSTLLELRPVSAVGTLKFASAEDPVFQRILMRFRYETLGGNIDLKIS